MLAKIIDFSITKRREFLMYEGYQPLDSIFYILDGGINYETAGKSGSVAAGDAIFFDSTESMRRSINGSVKFLYVKFKKNDADIFPLEAGKVERISERALEDMKNIVSLTEGAKHGALALAEHYLNDFLISVNDFHQGLVHNPKGNLPERLPSGASLPKSPIVTKVRSFVEDNISRKISIDEIARAAGVSKSALCKKFKDASAKTVFEYIEEERIDKACRLLSETNYSVSEIAELCGYESLYYFSSTFKKATGKSPKAFRLG